METNPLHLAPDHTTRWWPVTLFVTLCMIRTPTMPWNCYKQNRNIFLECSTKRLTYKRPSYRRTGAHPFSRSVLTWRSANRKSSFSSTSRPTLCTHWSLTGNTAPPHWVVTRGRIWLVPRRLCSATVTGRGSMLRVATVPFQRQESVTCD